MMCEARRLSVGGPAPKDSPDSRKVPMEAEQPQDPVCQDWEGEGLAWLPAEKGHLCTPSGAIRQLAQSPVC